MISTLVTGFLEAKVAFFGYNLRQSRREFSVHPSRVVSKETTSSTGRNFFKVLKSSSTISFEEKIE